jgi:hypothetical protein
MESETPKGNDPPEDPLDDLRTLQELLRRSYRRASPWCSPRQLRSVWGGAGSPRPRNIRSGKVLDPPSRLDVDAQPVVEGGGHAAQASRERSDLLGGGPPGQDRPVPIAAALTKSRTVEVMITPVRWSRTGSRRWSPRRRRGWSCRRAERAAGWRQRRARLPLDRQRDRRDRQRRHLARDRADRHHPGCTPSAASRWRRGRAPGRCGGSAPSARGSPTSRAGMRGPRRRRLAARGSVFETRVVIGPIRRILVYETWSARRCDAARKTAPRPGPTQCSTARSVTSA